MKDDFERFSFNAATFIHSLEDLGLFTQFHAKTRRTACPECVTQAAVSVFSLTSTSGNETSDHISMNLE